MKNWKKGIALVVAAGLLTIAGAATALAASKTKLDTVTELYWGDDGTTANWEKVDDAYQYEVRLYCNESQVESMKTKKDSLDMEKKMTKEGDYTFKEMCIRDRPSMCWNRSGDIRFPIRLPTM